MLFETIDRYLADVKQFKSATYCRNEERSMLRVKEFLRKDIPIEDFRRKHGDTFS